MYIGDQWELIGTTTIDLSDYALKTDLIQSDWTQATTTSLDYIKNKPAIWDSEDYTVPDGQTYGNSNTKAINAIAANNKTNYAKGNYSWAEGYHPTSNRTVTINNVSTTLPYGASGDYSHAEGNYTIASGQSSHAEGNQTIASGIYSHAEGFNTKAHGIRSHSEGSSSVASGSYSHAEGGNTIASGNNSHAEGSNTIASGESSHAEGWHSTASGSYSHVEGTSNTASGIYSHAEGIGIVAQRKSQHVFGEYNILDTTGSTTSRGTYVEIVGNGTSSTLSNARTLDWNGNEWLAGKVTVANITPTADGDLTTKQYVDNTVAGISVPTISATSALTTGITTGTVTINGTTTTFYAPEAPSITITQALTTGIAAATITVGDTATTIYSTDGSKWNDVSLSKGGGANYAANTYIPQLTSPTGTFANLATATGTPTNYNIAKYDNHAMLHSATPTAGDKSNKVATTSFVADAITTSITPVAALTTGITIGSIDVSGTTTTFYAPEDKKYTVLIEIGEYNADESSIHKQIYSINFVNDQDSIDTIKQKILDGYIIEVTDGYALYHLTGFESTSEYTQIQFSRSTDEGIEIIDMYKDLEGSTLMYIFNPCEDIVWYQPYTGLTHGISGKLYAGNDSWDITYQDNQVGITNENTVGGNSTVKAFPVLYSKQVVSGADGVYQSSKANLKNGSILELIDNNDTYSAQYSPQSTKYCRTYTISGKEITETAEILPILDGVHRDSISYQTLIGTKYNNQIIPVGSTSTIGSSITPVYISNYEILPCTLPTPTTYTISMTGPTINLLADGVAASTITLPIWDGTLD